MIQTRYFYEYPLYRYCICKCSEKLGGNLTDILPISASFVTTEAGNNDKGNLWRLVIIKFLLKYYVIDSKSKGSHFYRPIGESVF